eukprot:COSAG02_NODE_690_length_18450_cov_6.643017_3_plen_186_part_00
MRAQDSGSSWQQQAARKFAGKGAVVLLPLWAVLVKFADQSSTSPELIETLVPAQTHRFCCSPALSIYWTTALFVFREARTRLNDIVEESQYRDEKTSAAMRWCCQAIFDARAEAFRAQIARDEFVQPLTAMDALEREKHQETLRRKWKEEEALHEELKDIYAQEQRPVSMPESRAERTAKPDRIL